MRSQVTAIPAHILLAAEEFLSRQYKLSHPTGCCDKGGRWFPSDSERQSCCSFIRSPSRAFPNSLQSHCRTAEHAAEKHGVSAQDVRRFAHLIKKAQKKIGGAE